MEVYNLNLRPLIRSKVSHIFRTQMTFSFSWLLFGVIYYIISFVHTDFDYLHLDANGTDTSKSAFVPGSSFQLFPIDIFQNQVVKLILSYEIPALLFRLILTVEG